MPESPTGQDRTEPATEKKRREAREKGRVARSTEIISVLILLAGLLYFRLAGGSLLAQLKVFLVGIIERISYARLDVAEATDILRETLLAILLMTAPLFILVIFAGLVGNVLQIGVMFVTDPITPKWERINPLEGVKRIFSKRGVNELFKSLIKTFLVGVVAGHAIHSEREVLLGLAEATGVSQILLTLGVVAFKVLIRCLIVLIIIAIIDYAVQRNIFETGLRMTRKEVERELRETEGDPLIRARFRQLREQRARQRMLGEVPSADVVITNPTELAIAMRYDPARDAAPVVLAKGRGYVAQRIRDIAEMHGIPIYEDKPLAQALFKTVEIGSYVPQELYTALAEVLAYLHRSNRLRRRIA